jgi:uncharacterized protein (TIGR03067 family)
MFAILVSLALTTTPHGQAQPVIKNADRALASSLNGNWSVVNLEKNDQPVVEAKNMTVKAKDGTLTISAKDGKPAMTWKAEFTAMGQITVQAKEGANSTTISKSGVFVLTGDYLAICLHDASNAATNEDARIVAGRDPKTKCTILLKRESRGRVTENR